MRVAWMLLLSAGLAAGDGATALHREDGDQRTRTSDDASRDVASPITAPTTQRSTAPNTGAVPMRTATPASGPPATGLTPSDPLQPRDLSPQQLQTLVAVAADVSPEWGAILSSRIKSDPEGVKRAILKSGRRLLALAVLRDQNPELYRLKVDELRMQDQMNALAKRYREAFDDRFPNEAQMTTYSAVTHYLKSVKAAGTDEGTAVMSKMRETPINDFQFDNVSIRADGQVMRPSLSVEVKSPEESKGPYDYYNVIATLDPEKVWRSPENSACPLLKQ